MQKNPHPDDDVPPAAAPIQHPVLGDQHHLPVLLVLAGVLLALVQDAAVVALRDAHKLAVVRTRPHHPSVEHLLRGGGDAEAARGGARIKIGTEHYVHV